MRVFYGIPPLTPAVGQPILQIIYSESNEEKYICIKANMSQM